MGKPLCGRDSQRSSRPLAGGEGLAAPSPNLLRRFCSAAHLTLLNASVIKSCVHHWLLNRKESYESTHPLSKISDKATVCRKYEIVITLMFRCYCNVSTFIDADGRQPWAIYFARFGRKIDLWPTYRSVAWFHQRQQCRDVSNFLL